MQGFPRASVLEYHLIYINAIKSIPSSRVVAVAHELGVFPLVVTACTQQVYCMLGLREAML